AATTGPYAPAAHTPDKRQIAIISEGARPRYVRPFTLSAARSGCLRFRDSLVPDAPSSLPAKQVLGSPACVFAVRTSRSSIPVSDRKPREVLNRFMFARKPQSPIQLPLLPDAHSTGRLPDADAANCPV